MKKKRLALKLSGETLGGSSGQGFDCKFIRQLLLNLVTISDYEIVIIVGGGNIFRGVQKDQVQIPQAPADQMGMMATLMNGILLKEIFKSLGQKVELLSSLHCPQICDAYQIDHADELLRSGTFVICAGGNSVPYFTTDTTAVIRACELECNLIMKATKVKGIFSGDPYENPNVQFYKHLTYQEVLERNLKVMDRSAFEMAENHKIPIVVFSIFESNPFSSVFNKTCDYTVVCGQNQEGEIL